MGPTRDDGSAGHRDVGPLRAAAGWAASKLRRRRLPVIQQLDQLECGAASLAMILNYHGRNTRIEELRERCGVGRDGLTALTISEAARAYGLRVKAYTIEPENIRQIRLPAIIHWNFNHFVVLERWTSRGATIVDPASGRRRVKPVEFDAAFTGVALTFEPGVRFERRRRAGRSAWWSYLQHALRAPGTFGVLGQVLLASLFLTVLGLTVPLFTKVLVDYVLPHNVTGIMGIVSFGVLVVGLTLLVTNYLRGALIVFLQARLDSQLMLGFFEHVLSLPFKFFQQRSSGDLLMRLSSNTMIRQMLTNQSLSVVLDGSLTVAYAAILLTMAPLFGATALVIGAVQVGVLVGTTRRMHTLMEQDLAAQAASEGYLVEALTGISTLKASGSEDRAMERWSDLFFTQLNASLRREHLSAAIGAVLSMLSTASPLVLLWVGAFYVLDGRMSLGTMLAMNAIATAFLTPLSSLVSAGQQLQLAGAYLARITDVVQAKPEQNPEEVTTAPPLTGKIDLRDVSFRYDPNAPWALRNVSLNIEPGQKVAVVGHTGSGKSTLAKLLLGLHPPEEGELLYDGVPLRSLNYRTLRRQFGVVLQESSLFSGSIRENIAFNDPTLPFEKVVQAARLAAIHEDVGRMPMGYETLVAEAGSALSGGQRQRLSMARALAHEPAVAVLDEATSHLDAVTESCVHQNISELSCTRVVVAHRLSTVRDADLILVIEGGEIVERGTHEELVSLNGHYAALIRSQLDTREAREVSLPARPNSGRHVFAGFGAADSNVEVRGDHTNHRA